MQVGRAEVLLQKGSWQQQEQGVSRPSRPASPQQGNASKQSQRNQTICSAKVQTKRLQQETATEMAPG